MGCSSTGHGLCHPGGAIPRFPNRQATPFLDVRDPATCDVDTSVAPRDSDNSFIRSSALSHGCVSPCRSAGAAAAECNDARAWPTNSMTRGVIRRPRRRGYRGTKLSRPPCRHRTRQRRIVRVVTPKRRAAAVGPWTSATWSTVSPLSYPPAVLQPHLHLAESNHWSPLSGSRPAHQSQRGQSSRDTSMRIFAS